MHLTGAVDQPSTFDRLKSGAKMHYPEHLQAELKSLGRPIPPEMIKRFRRFEWTTNLRYESGRRPRGEVRGYLKVATATINWAKGEMK